MRTSIFPWLNLIEERATDDGGMVRTWEMIGVGDVVKRVKLAEHRRWGRWSYSAWRERQRYLMNGGFWWELA